jgi:hypothetical protein
MQVHAILRAANQMAEPPKLEINESHSSTRRLLKKWSPEE